MKNSSLAQFSSVFADEFRALGFKRVGSSSVLSRSTGEVTACAFVAKSRMGQSAQAVVGFWHRGLSTDGSMALGNRLKTESVLGDLSECGVGAEKWWDLDEEFEVRLPACIRSLASPMINSLRSYHVLVKIGEHEFGKQFRFDASLLMSGDPSDRESVTEEQFPSRESHRLVCKSSLALSLNELGFASFENERQFAFVRDRGELIDVVEPVRTSMGFHTYFNCFVTTKAFWSVRKELRSLLVQTNGGELGERSFSSGIRCVETSALKSTEACAQVALRIREQALPFFSEIADRNSFLNALNRGWENTLRPGLGRLWA